MTPSRNTAFYRTVTRILGISLSVTGVLFHRRGLMDWREPLFILTCVMLQEMFLFLPVLRRFRSFVLAFYLMLPALFVLASIDKIEPHRGDAIALALNSPLPLLLLPIQLMVLYTREAARLSSLVLVLTLFFVVAGLRRQVDDLVWPWMLVTGVLACSYLAFAYPARVQLNLFSQFEGRSFAPAVSSTGGLVRASFFGALWAAVVCSLLLSFVLFLAIPRFRFSSGEKPEDAAALEQHPGRGNKGGESGGPRNRGRDLSSVAALSDKVELGDFGEIKQSMVRALELRALSTETPRPTTPPSPVYLRAYTYGVFDGQSWSPLPTAGTDARQLAQGQARRRPLPNSRPPRADWKSASYAVLVLDGGIGGKGELPLVGEPAALLDFAGNATWDARSGVVRAPSVTKGSEYGFTSLEFDYDYSALEDAVAGTVPAPLPPDNVTRSASAPSPSYWLLPRNLRDKLSGLPLVTEVRERARSRTSGSVRLHSPVAAARWLVRYFTNQARVPNEVYRYSLTQRPAPGPDCIYRFLTSERYGHCEYFASAMCMVLRAAGVPCRLAAGFRASTFNEERNVYEVGASEAHAWVEVYVRDYGWIPFDPTPGADVTNPEQPPLPEQPEQPEPDQPPPPLPKGAEVNPKTPEEEPRQGDPIVDFGQEAQRKLMDDFNSSWGDGLSAMEDALSPLTAWMPEMLPGSALARLGILLAPVSAGVLVFLWRRGKRRKLEKRVLDEMGADTLRGATRRQRDLYLSLLLELARHGYHKRPHETPREFAWRVARRGGEAFAPVRELTEIFYRVRFGADAKNEESVFKRLLSAFATRLRHVSASSKTPAAPEADTSA